MPVDPALIQSMQQSGDLPDYLSKVDPALLASMANHGELKFNQAGLVPTPTLNDIADQLRTKPTIGRLQSEIAGDNAVVPHPIGPVSGGNPSAPAAFGGQQNPGAPLPANAGMSRADIASTPGTYVTPGLVKAVAGQKLQEWGNAAGQDIQTAGKLAAGALIASGGSTVPIGQFLDQNGQFDPNSFPGAPEAIGMAKQAINGPTVQGTGALVTGQPSKAFGLYGQIPGQIWDGFQHDPAGTIAALMGTAGLAGGVLRGGAGLVLKVGALDDAIDAAVSKGRIEDADALRAKRAIAQQIAGGLAQAGDTMHYISSGGELGEMVNEGITNLVKAGVGKVTGVFKGAPAAEAAPPTINPDQAAAAAGIPDTETQIAQAAPDTAAATADSASSPAASTAPRTPAQTLTLVQDYVGRNPNASIGDIARDFGIDRGRAQQLLEAAQTTKPTVPGTSVPTPELSGQSSAAITTPAGSVKVRGVNIPIPPKPTLAPVDAAAAAPAPTAIAAPVTPTRPSPIPSALEGQAAAIESVPLPNQSAPKIAGQGGADLQMALSSGLQRTNGFGSIVLTDGTEVRTNPINRNIDQDGNIMAGDGNFVHASAVAAVKDHSGNVIWEAKPTEGQPIASKPSEPAPSSTPNQADQTTQAQAPVKPASTPKASGRAKAAPADDTQVSTVKARLQAAGHPVVTADEMQPGGSSSPDNSLSGGSGSASTSPKPRNVKPASNGRAAATPPDPFEDDGVVLRPAENAPAVKKAAPALDPDRVALLEAVNKQYAEQKSIYEATRDRAAQQFKARGESPNSSVSYLSAQSGLKRLAMEHAANVRQITGELTGIERAAAEKHAQSNHIGKEVETTVDGKTERGTIVGMSFGKIRIDVGDGKIVKVDADQVRTAPGYVAETPELQALRREFGVKKDLENAGKQEPTSLTRHLDHAANEAADRIQKRNKGRLNAGVDPDDYRDMAIWGASKIAKGLLDGGNFVRALVQAFGERVRPVAAHVFELAKLTAKAFVADESGTFDAHAMGKKIGEIFKKDTSKLGEPQYGPDDHMSLLQRAKFVSSGGPFRSTAALSEPVAQALMHVATFRETAAAYNEYMLQRELGAGTGRPLTPEQEDLLGRYFTHRRAEHFELTGHDYNKQAVPKLTPEELQRVQSDPAIQHAIQTYKSGRGAFIRDARIATSPGMKLADVPEGDFLSLLATKGAKGEDLGEATALPPTGTVPKAGPSRFAQEANGQASEYNHSFRERAAVSATEMIRQGALHEFSVELLNTRDADGNPLAAVNAKTVVGADGAPKIAEGQAPERIPLPGTIKFDGKVYQAKELNTNILLQGKRGNLVRVRIAVPAAIADDFDRAIKPNFDMNRALGPGAHTLGQHVGDLAVGLSLSNPTEATTHAWRLCSVAGAIPEVNATLKARGFRSIAPAFHVLKRVLDLDGSSRAFQEDVMHLNKIGAGSTRAFQHAIDEGWISKVPGLKQLSSMNHRLLFGIPGGKGLSGLWRNGGFDVRLRVMLLRLQRELEPNATPARQREFINQFGQYASIKDPTIVHARIFNPYAATKLPLLATELRQATGDTGIKGLTPQGRLLLGARTAANATIATIATHYALNYMLSGHSPLDNDAGHKLDIEYVNPVTHQKGYIPLRLLNPAQSRVLNETGIGQTAEDVLSGEGAGHAANHLARGVANAGSSILFGHPALGAAITALTGYAPYIDKGGRPYHAAPTAVNPNNQALVNLVAGYGNINSIGAAGVEKGMEWAGLTKPRAK